MSRIQGKNNSNRLSTAPIYVDIDVSKSFLDVYIHPIGTHYQLGNDKKRPQETCRAVAPIRKSTRGALVIPPQIKGVQK